MGLGTGNHRSHLALPQRSRPLAAGALEQPDQSGADEKENA
jgi:hypothetical protein